jgi:colicin import membrane protein
MSSEYEKNVTKLIQEKLDKLEYLKKAENWDNSQVQRLVNEIETLESLFENYNLGMNYFRRARGGRSGLRE